MRKVIDGRTFNTEQSLKFYEWTNGADPDDYSYRSETLYRTRIHRIYFVVAIPGKGAKPQFFPLSSDDAALQWLQNHGNPNDPEYLKAVDLVQMRGPIQEPKVKKNFELPVSTVAILKREEQRRGLTQTALVNHAILQTFGKDD